MFILKDCMHTLGHFFQLTIVLGKNYLLEDLVLVHGCVRLKGCTCLEN